MSERGLEQQVELLMQGTEYGDEALRQAMAGELRERLAEAQQHGRPLRVYCGFDPRTADLHIGHMVPIRKMRQFQQLGHEVTFLIGRFTSLVGDPSDKDQVRAQISMEQATENAETYAQQAFKILDAANTKIEYNDTWLAKLTFADLIELTSHFTVQQFLARDAFRKRFDADDPIYLHEYLYAIMQAYDAYHMRSDVQIGGSDQLFNIITAARKLMEALGAKPNIGIVLGILPGTDGVVKMSKSLGNHIPLNTTPEDMFGKVMSVPDTAMGDYFRLATRWGPEQVSEIERGLEAGRLHPRDAKLKLAREIVEIYFGEQAAGQAQDEFRTVFQQGGKPAEIDELLVPSGTTPVEIMVRAGLASSNGEARRLMAQRGVRLDDRVLQDPDEVLALERPAVLRVGKRRFVRLLPPGG